MANDLPDIRGRLVLDDSQVAEVMGRVGNQAETMGKKMRTESDNASTGFHLLGLSAAKAGEELGIPYRASHLLGTRIAKMARSEFPAWGVALGVTGVAIAATVGLIDYMAEQKEKATKAINDSATALAAEVKELISNQAALDNVKASTYDLMLAKRDLALIQIPEKIRDEKDKLAKLNEEYQKLSKTMNENAYESEAMMRIFSNAELVIRMEQQKEFNEKQAKIKIQQEEIKSEEELLKILINIDNLKTKRQFTGQDNRELKAFEELQKERAKSIIGLEAYQDRVTAILARNDEEERQIRVDSYNDMLTRLGQTERARVKSEAFITANERKENQLRWLMAQQTAGNIAQMADTMASIGGANARKWFTLAKEAATAEAIINTYQGATKALAQGGFWGAAMAASIIALGMAQVAKIQSTEFNGGGIQSGAVGTYSANPVTGLPAQSQGTSQPTIIIYVDGKRANIGDLAKDTLRYIYNQHGSVGGFSLAVERSA